MLDADIWAEGFFYHFREFSLGIYSFVGVFLGLGQGSVKS